MDKAEGNKLKLFLDLNGTIIYRNARALELKGEKKIGQRYTCLRPGTIENMKKLMDFYDIYIYSSMEKKNIDATITELFAGTNIRIVDIFDRGWNIKDPNGSQPYDTIRDMQRIWIHLEAKGVTPSNTILIDNEARKVEACKYNAIIIPQIAIEEIRLLSSTRLDHMTAYLIELAKSGVNDVRDYIKERPYLIPEVVNKIESIGLANKEDMKDLILDFSHLDNKEVVLTNFKSKMIVIIPLPIPEGFRVDKRVSYAALALSKVTHRVEFPTAP